MFRILLGVWIGFSFGLLQVPWQHAIIIFIGYGFLIVGLERAVESETRDKLDVEYIAIKDRLESILKIIREKETQEKEHIEPEIRWERE